MKAYYQIHLKERHTHLSWRKWLLKNEWAIYAIALAGIIFIGKLFP